MYKNDYMHNTETHSYTHHFFRIMTIAPSSRDPDSSLQLSLWTGAPRIASLLNRDAIG